MGRDAGDEGQTSELPNFEKAKVPEAKITEYLLNEAHTSNQGKTDFLRVL
jgi:hypothetical protein